MVLPAEGGVSNHFKDDQTRAQMLMYTHHGHGHFGLLKISLNCSVFNGGLIVQQASSMTNKKQELGLN